jgi:hypothetical protein
MPARKTPLTVEQILAWTDAFHGAAGAWPTAKSGPVAGAGGATWGAIDRALRRGLRGLPGGSSLARLLAEHRGIRRRRLAPKLTEQQILLWARAYRVRKGRWPGARSGPVAGAPGVTWNAINQALYLGLRGLAGGSSLAKLLGGRELPNTGT